MIAGGQVSGFVEPRLAFGQTRSLDAPLWLFTALSVIGVDLAIAAWWLRRRRRVRDLPDIVPSAPPGDPYLPSDEGIRLEQLKTISGLRDSGALTEAEFQVEKRRILDGL